MASPSASAPNLTDFQTFITNVMGIPATQLPAGSPTIQHAFDFALNVANADMASVPSEPTSYSFYALAVYNLGGHSIIEFAPDQSWSIASATWAAGVVTATTNATHSIAPGDAVDIAGLSPLAYDGRAMVQAVPNGTQFTYNVRVPGASTATIIAAGATVTEYFFAQLRAQWKLAAFVPGVIGSSSDTGTSASITNPDFFKGLRLLDLQLLKTPYGRRYLQLAQAYGPTIWGLS